jgi:hypothetical protein
LAGVAGDETETFMNTEIALLKRQNRLLMATVAAGAAFFAFVAADSTKTRFKEIDVERINIVTAEGKREMTISNRKMLPRVVIDGIESTTDRNMPGIVFFNDIGDECGGLVYKGSLGKDGNPNSGMHFSMDRFGGDQQLALGHYEGGGSMETGLNVYDRGLHKDYDHLFEALRKATGDDEKRALRQKIQDAGGYQTQRVFVGKTGGKSSAVILADTKGLPRIMMLVPPDGDGEPSLQFYDGSGKVVYTIPPVPEKKVE